MKLDGIKATNIELTEAIERRVASRVEKLGKLTKRLQPASCVVEIGKPSQHHQKGPDVYYAEFQVTAGGKEFYSNKSEPDLYKAIEKVKDDMYRQINDWKKRELSNRRKEGSRLKRLLRFGRED